MEKLTVIKIGGNVIDDPVELDAFLERFSQLEGRRLLVHGGGALASAMLADMGIQPQMVGGRRITDAQTLKIVTMVYAGWINKDIVARLQSLGCNAAGFSGADGDAIPAVKRPAGAVDFGYVGDVDPSNINSSFVAMLIEAGVTPVFCAITHDGAGALLNTNADTIASSLAVAMGAEYDTELIYCFEKPGVLSDPDDEDSVIDSLNKSGYEAMKASGAVKGGMLAKLENVFFALDNGVKKIIIKHAADLPDNDAGTTITLN